MGGDTRISMELQPVPHSFRAFVEKAVKDERTMLCFVESPITTLRAAGVPVSDDSLTKDDCTRLIKVIGKLRNLVSSKKLAASFRFEDVFSIGSKVSYQSSKSESDSVCRTEFSPKTECQSSSKTEQGIDTKWNSSWLHTHIDERGISAPLFSPGDMTDVIARMDARVGAITQKVVR